MFEPVNAVKSDNDKAILCDFCASCDDSGSCTGCNVAGDTGR